MSTSVSSTAPTSVLSTTPTSGITFNSGNTPTPGTTTRMSSLRRNVPSHYRLHGFDGSNCTSGQPLKVVRFVSNTRYAGGKKYSHGAEYGRVAQTSSKTRSDTIKNGSDSDDTPTSDSSFQQMMCAVEERRTRALAGPDCTELSISSDEDFEDAKDRNTFGVVSDSKTTDSSIWPSAKWMERYARDVQPAIPEAELSALLASEHTFICHICEGEMTNGVCKECQHECEDESECRWVF